MAVNRVLGMLLVGIWLIALVLVGGKTTAFPICNIDSTEMMNQCLPSVSGKSPKPPSKQCCAAVRKAKLPCLCGYKNVLPALGIQPKLALALPKKCGLATPPECNF
ncbi:hypothetical protein LWI28_016895 [Acer negundo]|uniref:Bifunctional inhibitor/plant lipid transfer protein/seed storage helical domain-containing protein n=1 Tax=Acer negundo TaxID=4023 RepID=A0AAD5J592_ACENE|nr:hypothetical protein LWI28_016895 [Acer negundo]KAK4852504.1 hypothetical protein QYF36_024681 [Acer negundo]